MSTIMGKSGYVYVYMGDPIPTTPVAVQCIDSWSMAIATDAIDDTAFGTTTGTVFRTFSHGLRSATGNAAGNFSNSDARFSVISAVLFSSTPTVVNCAFWLDTAHHVSASCIITGFTVNENVAEKVTFGFDFTVSGTPVYA